MRAWIQFSVEVRAKSPPLEEGAGEKLSSGSWPVRAFEMVLLEAGVQFARGLPLEIHFRQGIDGAGGRCFGGSLALRWPPISMLSPLGVECDE